MDFLDPKATRRHRIRLFIGYGLMATVILTTAAILVFQAYGFDVDRKTGEVIQNGLVFVDSAPDDATVVLNDQIQKEKTNSRFALPSGDYRLKVQKEGYRDWQRSFNLNGGEVERFHYPMLIPTDIVRQELQAFDAAPTFTTQSPDRRWLLLNQADFITNFTEYDLESTTTAAQKPKSRTFTVPASVFTNVAGAHTLELTEWSTDNKHILVNHTFPGGNEFIVISRDQPETSININRLLGQNPTTVTLRDKKFDQWYLYTKEGGLLQTADAKKTVANLLSGVISFKTHDESTVLYSVATADPAKQSVILKQGTNSFPIKDVAAGAVLLDIARYEGKWYVVIGADAEQKTYIYEDPVQVLQKKDGTLLFPASILKSAGPLSAVSFSQNTRFIVSQSGQHFETFDIDDGQAYKFDITDVFDPGTKVTWMDGHRLTARSQNKSFMFDFDGSNQQTLATSLPVAPLFFNRDYTVIYNMAAATAPGKFSLFDGQLRLEGDR